MEKLKYVWLDSRNDTNINKLNKSKSTNNLQFSLNNQISSNFNFDTKSSLLKQNRKMPEFGVIKFVNKNTTNHKNSFHNNALPLKALNKSSSSTLINFNNLLNDKKNNTIAKEIEMKNNFSFMKKNYLLTETQPQNQLNQFQQYPNSNNLNNNNHDKIDRLCQKLSQISMKKQTNMQVEINESILNKIEELNQKISIQEKDLQENLKFNKEKLQEFYKQMKQIQKRSQFYTSYRLKTIIQLGRKVKNFIQKQKNDRLIIQERIIRLFQQKCQYIQNSIISTIKARQELVFKIDNDFQEIIPNLQQELQLQLTIMVEQLTQIQKVTKRQVEQFKNMITSQTIHAKQSKTKIQELMKKTVSQIKNQIQCEKRQRQKKGEKLMQLFEQACLKLTN